MPLKHLKRLELKKTPPVWLYAQSDRVGSSIQAEESSPPVHMVPTSSAEVAHRRDPTNEVPVEVARIERPQNYKLWRPFESDCSHPQPHRAFRCFCGSAFARNEELTRHLRIHSGQRPFECHQCGRRFGRKDHRDKHLKTHLRNEYKRVHRCPVGHCPGRYTRTDALNRHMLAAHGFRRSRKRHSQETVKDQEVPAIPVSSPPVMPSIAIPPMVSQQIRTQTSAQSAGPLTSTNQTVCDRSAPQLQRDIHKMILREAILSRNRLGLLGGFPPEKLLLWQRWL